MTKRTMLIAIASVVTTAALAAQASARVDGTWNMTVTGSGAHGDMSATLTLAQKELKVTGTLSAHGNEHSLTGEFKEGTLTLEATDVPADKTLSLTAKLQEDGSLQGYLSGPMGDMRWTATRAKDRH